MSSSAKNVMQLELLYIAGGSVSWKLHEHMNTFWPSNSNPRYIPHRDASIWYQKSYMRMSLGALHGCPKPETIQMSTINSMDKQILVHSYKGYEYYKFLFGNEY